MSDSPFDNTPEADPAEIPVSKSRRRKEYVDPTGDSGKRAKPQNFNQKTGHE